MTENGRSEARLLSRFRLATIAVLLFCVLVYVVAGIFELPGLRPEFHIDPAVLGLFFGAILPLVGVEVLSQVLSRAASKPKDRNDD